MAGQGKSALTAALAGGDTTDQPPTARLRLDPKAFPCLAGFNVGGAVPPLVAGADGLGELVSGFEKVSLRGDQLAGSAPTAGLLSDGSAAVSARSRVGAFCFFWGGARERKKAFLGRTTGVEDASVLSFSQPPHPRSLTLARPHTLSRTAPSFPGRLRAQPTPPPGRSGTPAPGRVADGDLKRREKEVFACERGGRGPGRAWGKKKSLSHAQLHPSTTTPGRAPVGLPRLRRPRTQLDLGRGHRVPPRRPVGCRPGAHPAGHAHVARPCRALRPVLRPRGRPVRRG